MNVQTHGFRRCIGIAITKSIHKIFVGMIELFQLPPPWTQSHVDARECVCSIA